MQKSRLPFLLTVVFDKIYATFTEKVASKQQKLHCCCCCSHNIGQRSQRYDSCQPCGC